MFPVYSMSRKGCLRSIVCILLFSVGKSRKLAQNIAGGFFNMELTEPALCHLITMLRILSISQTLSIDIASDKSAWHRIETMTETVV